MRKYDIKKYLKQYSYFFGDLMLTFDVVLFLFTVRGLWLVCCRNSQIELIWAVWILYDLNLEEDEHEMN